MAQCEYCKEEMTTSQGCDSFDSIVLNGTEYKRIRFGEYPDHGYDYGWETCGDCGTHLGHIHHFGCDMEVCPSCGEQLISCYCNIEEIVPTAQY